MNNLVKYKKGIRFNYFKIIKEMPKHITPSGSYQRKFLCECDCGKEKVVFLNALKSGRSKSCGCLQKKLTSERFRKHGMSFSREHIIWTGMKQRCLNKNVPDYNNYGGREIKICNEWIESFENFYKDMGDCPKGLTLDRIDNNGNYRKENCRWATKEEQSNNKRNNIFLTKNEKTLTVTQWEKELGFNINTLAQRLRRGWSVEKALSLSTK